jgi:3-methylcrotonyl-CoA carboxylase alpha subunit
MFERDCSVQRRHHMVLVVAPAPGMTPERRARMGAAAVAAARAVSYRGAGTVEFIVDAAGEFHFMEMNTRLQVEHPVTEMITGLDLVEWQLRVAAGEPLPLAQSALRIHGHAIEARIYAEDPARDFLPSIGRLARLKTPETHARVRIDTGVHEGGQISPYYDPMIAKLIVHGDDRPQAIALMRAALERYEVVGVSTNVEFLHRLTTAPAFVEGRLDTALIEREREHLFAPRASPSEEIWRAAAAAAITVPESTPGPWGDVSGWRVGGVHPQRAVRLKLGDVERDICVSVPPAPGLDAPAATRHGNAIHVFEAGRHYVFDVADPYLPPADAADHHGGLVAPMPGRVLAVHVSEGQEVARGAPLVVMEAMKMEHTVTAPRAGKVEKVFCAAGEQVKEGSELLILR